MSDDGDETVRVNHLMDRELREAAQENTEHGELSEHVRRVYKTAAYGDAEGRRSQLQMELEQTRDEKDRLRSEIRGLQSEMENVERREARLEERMESVREDDQKYEGHLESIETALLNGQHIFEGHGAVKRAAETGRKDPSEVIADLKERNPNVPDYAFAESMKTEKRWTGLSEE